VLEVMGVSRQVRRGLGALQHGLGTTDEDIGRVLDVLPSTVERCACCRHWP